ncbi:MAG: hypothetical protein Q7R39_04535 [Dehalococcoidia bacterium]|nr:hypothetical protein [Dehalococcoidia bacterium]
MAKNIVINGRKATCRVSKGRIICKFVKKKRSRRGARRASIRSAGRTYARKAGGGRAAHRAAHTRVNKKGGAKKKAAMARIADLWNRDQISAEERDSMIAKVEGTSNFDASLMGLRKRRKSRRGKR